MGFNPDGTWHQGDERAQSRNEWHVVPGTTFHHMIDWSALRDFWDALVRSRRAVEMTQYLQIAGYGGRLQYIVPQVLGGHIHHVRDRHRMDHDLLEEAICWQVFNLFEGPDGRFRRPHAPDPADGLRVRYFRPLGDTTYDYPITVQPHIDRVNTLWRAFQQMAVFTNTGAAGPLTQCLNLLGGVSHLLVIPAFDMNWFALSQARFRGLTRHQRQQFFAGCMANGGWLHANADAVYAALFGA